jgi:hypothetical protein
MIRAADLALLACTPVITMDAGRLCFILWAQRTARKGTAAPGRPATTAARVSGE